MTKRTAMYGLILALGFSMGCTSVNDFWSERSEVQKHAAIGGAVGAVGGLAYEAAFAGPETAEAIGIGAGGGALIGALFGDWNQENLKIQEYEDKLRAMSKELDATNEKLRASQRKGQSQARDIAGLQAQIAELKRQIAALKDELAKSKGARIEMSMPNDVLFHSGSARLTSGGRALLDKAAGKIKDAHLDKKIQIEGHTDSDPISQSNWKSNWELGAARALAVLHYLEDHHGIKGKSLSAATYSYHKPVGGDKSENRRSVIVLYTAWPTN